MRKRLDEEGALSDTDDPPGKRCNQGKRLRTGLRWRSRKTRGALAARLSGELKVRLACEVWVACKRGS